MCTKVYLPVRIRCGMQCFYRFLVGNCITHPGVHKHCKQTPISRCDAMHGARSHCELSTTIATALVVTGLRKAFRYHSWSSIFRSGSREHRGLCVRWGHNGGVAKSANYFGMMDDRTEHGFTAHINSIPKSQCRMMG